MAVDYWQGNYWREVSSNLSPPPQWDGQKFVFIDPVFGDGDGMGSPKLRYIGPSLAGVLSIPMPLNVLAVSHPVKIQMIAADASIIATWLFSSTGTQTILLPTDSIPPGEFFDLAFSPGKEGIPQIYDAEFTIGEPIRQQVFVYTMNRVGQVGAWSRYVFPFEIDATAQLGETLFLRSGDSIYRVTEDATTDAGAPIEGIVQWPWLDFGTPGVTKMLQSLDVVGEGPGNVSLQVGYDQRSVEAFTPAYTIPIDTLTGMPVPIPVSAPTLSVRLTFTGKWSLQAVNVNLAENRRTT